MTDENSQETQNPQILEIENKLRRFSQNDLNAILTLINALNEKY